MIVPAATQRRYWHDVLGRAGLTALPRWPGPADADVAEHVEPLPYGLAPTTGQMLAAHAVVLAALSGEREVTAGYLAAPGGPTLPLQLVTTSATGPSTWRALVEAATRAEQWLQGCRETPVDEVAAELGRVGPLFETELDLHGDASDLAPHTVLRVSVGAAHLRVRYRTAAVDAAAAARVAGYHVEALTALTSDLDAEPRSLVSAAERAFQFDDLAGPERELPDERFHELFEQRAAARPDAVAAECAGRQWTYRELNGRANRLARALVARGLRSEGVVAVVAERNLDWMAAVIAIFKAGGVYLPIEPHFPAERIARMLARAECQLVLSEPGSDAGLRQAMTSAPRRQVVLFEDAYAEDHADNDLGVAVAPDQLAYIYFTSGSTGEPKGAMCEHAGFVNHLLAKIEDLGIAEGAVVAQIAPQCFDISLWQLVSALLVGGRTRIVPQELILDPQQFIDEIAAGRVEVMQVVPSYLEVVASYLEQRRLDHQPGALPDLRIISATGEALKADIVKRWFAVAPDVPLVNAYGLTETSDDTNHEVLREVPASGKIPLGPAVRNVRIYVVDENLDPVPFGAPGLIAFSGVCVGRGYINDPERTRACYMQDPHRPGQRLYLGGDYGRWLPEGKLEFLGRRDHQVKIRGFRIEIGEIDNALLLAPGVRDAATVVSDRNGSAHLVAFYASDAMIPAETLAAQLAEKLPEYMVPTAFHHRTSLPLTPNGKIDTKALRALAAEIAVIDGDVVAPPTTPTELMLAAAFAKALDVPVESLGRQDNFFDRGGTSLTAVKLVIATGRLVTIREITRQPVLADLAAHIDRHADA